MSDLIFKEQQSAYIAEIASTRIVTERNALHEKRIRVRQPSVVIGLVVLR